SNLSPAVRPGDSRRSRWGADSDRGGTREWSDPGTIEPNTLTKTRSTRQSAACFVISVGTAGVPREGTPRSYSADLHQLQIEGQLLPGERMIRIEGDRLLRHLGDPRDGALVPLRD